MGPARFRDHGFWVEDDRTCFGHLVGYICEGCCSAVMFVVDFFFID